MKYDLQFLTGQEAIDEILCQLIDRLEGAFPNQVLAYYLNGSYAGHYGIASSDVDLAVIVVEDMQAIDRAYEIISDLNDQALVELDVGFIRANQMVRPALMFRGQLIYGEDVRDRLQVMPIDYWVRERIHAGCWLICHLHNRAGCAYLPLEYPDADGAFYGYDGRVAKSREGNQQAGLKNMMRATSWAATGLVALHTRQYVIDKTECIRLYREKIGDEWSDHLETLFDVCRVKWAYCVPERVEDREQLRRICERNLAFENHYLTVYRDFLLDELQSEDIDRLNDALYFLAKTPFCDDEILDHVRSLKNDAPLQKHVNKVITAYQKVM